MGRPKNPDPERIVRVKSNIKSIDGAAWEVRIPDGASVIVVGPNASMKSAFTQASSLAVGGYADDLAGRYGVRDGGLLLTMVQGDHLFAEAETSGGHVWRFDVHREGGTVKKSVWTVDGEPVKESQALPVGDVKAVLQMGEAKARPEVLRWMSEAMTLTEVDVRSKLGVSLQARYASIAENLARSGEFASPVDELLAVGAWVKKAMSDAKKEVTTTETLLHGILGGVEAPTEMELSRASQAVQDATSMLEATVRWETASDAGQRLREAQEAAKQWEEEVTRLKEQLQDDSGAPGLDTIPTLLQWIDFGAGIDQCPVCGEHGVADHLRTSSRPHFARRMSEGADTLDGLDDASKCLTSWSREVSRITEQIEAASLSGPKPDVTTEDARKLLSEAQARRYTLVAASAAAEQTKRAKDKITAKSAEAQDLERLVEAVAEATKALLTQTRQRFSEAVSEKLPKSWRSEGVTFDVEVEDNGREVCRVGLRGGSRGSDLRPAMSGAEGEVVAMGISAVISTDGAKGRGGPEAAAAKLRLLIPQDRAWDPATLADACRALGAGPWQSMITSTVRPLRRCPSGWVILQSETMTVDETSGEETPEKVDEPSPTPQATPESSIPEDVQKIADDVLTLAKAANEGDPLACTLTSSRHILRRLREIHRDHGRVKMQQLYEAITGLPPDKKAYGDQLISGIEKKVQMLRRLSPDAS
mgnify:CR=1 FL=1